MESELEVRTNAGLIARLIGASGDVKIIAPLP